MTIGLESKHAELLRNLAKFPHIVRTLLVNFKTTPETADQLVSMGYADKRRFNGRKVLYEITPAGRMALDGYDARIQVAADLMQPYVDHAAQQETKASDTMTANEWTPTVGAKTRIVGSYEYGEIVAIDGDTATVNICKWLETATYPLTALAPYMEGEAPAHTAAVDDAVTGDERYYCEKCGCEIAALDIVCEDCEAAMFRDATPDPRDAEITRLRAERDALADCLISAMQYGGMRFVQGNTAVVEFPDQDTLRLKFKDAAPAYRPVFVVVKSFDEPYPNGNRTEG